MGELKRLLKVVVADDFMPASLSQSAVVVHGFIDHVPTCDPPFVAADDGDDVVVHPL